jgi:hypothetical protein
VAPRFDDDVDDGLFHHPAPPHDRAAGWSSTETADGRSSDERASQTIWTGGGCFRFFVSVLVVAAGEAEEEEDDEGASNRTGSRFPNRGKSSNPLRPKSVSSDAFDDLISNESIC